MEYKVDDETTRPLTVKDFDPEDQPREKAQKHGCGVLTVPELLAIILRTGTTGNPITELCRNLMKENQGRLHRLERRTRKELLATKGIGLTKCIQIEAIMELMKRYAEEAPLREESINNADKIFHRMRYKIGNLEHEEVWILLVNRRNQVIKEVKLSSGTAIASLFDVKTAIKHALLEDADGVILSHNHPSGGVTPSIQDDQITKELKDACKFMKLRMLDHVIVTDTSYFSYHEEGRL